MTDKSNIRKLIEAVEAGDDRAAFWKVWPPENEGGQLAFTADRAFRGSLDAAKALHEALLPGWKVAGIHQEDSGLWWAELREGFITSYSQTVIAPHSFDALTPARAWLIAILKAYEAQQ